MCKQYFSILFLFVFLSCKVKPVQQSQTKTVNSSGEKIQTEQNMTNQKTQGVVSHQYRASGCATVILVKNDNTTETQVLIPLEPLDAGIDKDGKKVAFNFTLSRIRQPQGCTVGQPAVISDLEEVKH